MNNQKGSHIVLKSSDNQRTIVIPDYHEHDRGTLKAILRPAGIDF
ncbi:type II toxin-antitoxin system HicA family toxin [Methanospirillum sp.]